MVHHGGRALRPAAQEVSRQLTRRRLLPIVNDPDLVPAIAREMREQVRMPLLGVGSVPWSKRLDVLRSAETHGVNVVLCAPIPVEQLPEALKYDRLAGILSLGCDHEVIRHGTKSSYGVLAIPGVEGPASLSEAVTEKMEAMGVDAPGKLGDQCLVAIRSDCEYFQPIPDPPPPLPPLAPTDIGGYLKLGMHLLRRYAHEAVLGKERVLPVSTPHDVPKSGTRQLLRQFDDALRLVLHHVGRPEDVVPHLRAFAGIVIAPEIYSPDDIEPYVKLLVEDIHRRTGEGDAAGWMQYLLARDRRRAAAPAA